MKHIYALKHKNLSIVKKNLFTNTVIIAFVRQNQSWVNTYEAHTLQRFAVKNFMSYKSVFNLPQIVQFGQRIPSCGHSIYI